MRKGFSLIEVLIALSIMAILGSFVVPNIKKIQDKSYAMASEVNLRTFQSAVENYFLENNVYPVGSLAVNELFTLLNTAEFINTSPNNPYYKKAYANADTKGKITYVSDAGENYTLSLYNSTGQAVQLVLNKL